MKKLNFKATFVFTFIAVLSGNLVQADQVIPDDLIVDGSECVGLDCVNGEDFGFSTMVLKENNLRIRFTDTSTSASFPTNDWEITINDSANGGANYFAVHDVNGGNNLLKISPNGTVVMGLEIAEAFVLSPSGDLSIKGTLSDSSDVNLKENFIPVDNAEVLDKIMDLPMSTWNYKDNANKDRHIGSMAQDFYKAFEFGPDNLHIAPKDAAFVAIAGVKELVNDINIRDEKIDELEKKLSNLEASLNKLLKGNNNTSDIKQ